MEEKKRKNDPEKQEEKVQKLSYEKLNEACSQLYQQNQNLVRQLQQAEGMLMTKRLDYLFKIVEYSGAFDADFVQECVKEIEDILKASGPEPAE